MGLTKLVSTSKTAARMSPWTLMTPAQLRPLSSEPEEVVTWVHKRTSKITVTQNGVTGDYARSGVPAVYVSHQEVTLELFKEYA